MTNCKRILVLVNRTLSPVIVNLFYSCLPFLLDDLMMLQHELLHTVLLKFIVSQSL